jgi:membrane-associated protease RseP (regulator of RpoE activity)
MSDTKTTRIPVVLDVPFATTLIGFRPSQLPPLDPDIDGVTIGHVQHGSWAERVGIRLGDVITHINGKSVRQMRLESEFLKPFHDRPLKLEIQLAASVDDLTSAIQSFDWVSRLSDLREVRSMHSTPQETNIMFDNVFDKNSNRSEKSPLFDLSRWLTNKPEGQPENGSEMRVEVTVKPVPAVPNVLNTVQLYKPTSPPVKRKKKMKPARTIQVPTQLQTLKCIASHPLTVSIRLEQGINIPPYAGTLGMDYLMQPFRSDPYLELLMVPAVSSTLTVEQLVNTGPVEPTAIIQSPICDSNGVWNFSSTITVRTESWKPEGLLLVGRLMDYRRLEIARTMGVFAMKLDTLDILDDASKAKARSVSLTAVDASFDVSECKLKLRLFLLGKNTLVTEPVQATPNLQTDTINDSTDTESETSEEPEEQTLESFDSIIAQDRQRTPFERAFSKALTDIKNGDHGAIKLQDYSLR